MSFYEEHLARTEGRNSHITGKPATLQQPEAPKLGSISTPEPYEHQHYPKMVFKGEAAKQVQNGDELKQAFQDGWDVKRKEEQK